MSGEFGTSEGNERTNRFRPWRRSVSLPPGPTGCLVVFVLLSFLATGCAFGHKYEAISGRVVDADTGEPLEGAVVVAVYNVSMASVGGPVQQYEDAQEAMTDVRGEFTIPEKSLSRFIIFGGYENEPELYAAKPGYGEYVGVTRHRLELHPRANARRTSSGRLEFMLPRLASMTERRKYSDWLPVVPGHVTPYLVDYRKIPNFVELRDGEWETLGRLPPSVGEEGTR